LANIREPCLLQDTTDSAFIEEFGESTCVAIAVERQHWKCTRHDSGVM
jgi:hypothetical protein